MNAYKVALGAVIGLIYIAIFWVLPIFLQGNEAYILKVLILHVIVLSVLAPIFLISFLAAKAGY